MALNIVSVKYKGNTALVVCSNDEIFSVSLKAAAEMQIYGSGELNDEGERLLRAESEQYKCLQKATRYLSLRNRSVKEMKTYLAGKGFAALSIDKTINYLSDNSLLDDAVFAKEFLAAAFRKQKFGRRKITAELMKKGISKDIITELMPNEFEVDAEYERGMAAAVKKWKVLAGKENSTQKLSAFLQQRGFDWNIIRRIIKTLSDEQTDLL